MDETGQQPPDKDLRRLAAAESRYTEAAGQAARTLSREWGRLWASCCLRASPCWP